MPIRNNEHRTMPAIAIDADDNSRKLQLPLIFPPRTSVSTVETKNGTHTVFQFAGLKYPEKPYTIEKRYDGFYWIDKNRPGINIGLCGPHKNIGLAVIAFNKYYRGI